MLFSVMMIASSTFRPFHFAKKLLSTVTIATTISVSSFGLTDMPVAFAADVTTSLSSGTSASPISAFEKAVSSLETAETRGDTLNSMADVFKVASGRSVLAKSRYKKVTNADLKPLLIFISPALFILLENSRSNQYKEGYA